MILASSFDLNYFGSVIAVAIIAPCLLQFMLARQTRKTAAAAAAIAAKVKTEDWARQDEVAARLIASNAAAAEAMSGVAAQVIIIHGLVNSSLTERWQAELAAEESALDAVLALNKMKIEKGEPADTGLVFIKTSRIASIKEILAARQAQQESINKEAGLDTAKIGEAPND